jgi:hypothetical protein
MTRDPANFAGGDPNLYAYVHDDPINFIDPLGTGPWPKNPYAERALAATRTPYTPAVPPAPPPPPPAPLPASVAPNASEAVLDQLEARVAARSLPIQVDSGYCPPDGGGTSIYMVEAEAAEAEGGAGVGFTYWVYTGSAAVLEAVPWVMFATGVVYILYELAPTGDYAVRQWRDTHWL